MELLALMAEVLVSLQGEGHQAGELFHQRKCQSSLLPCHCWYFMCLAPLPEGGFQLLLNLVLLLPVIPFVPWAGCPVRFPSPVLILVFVL